jgi:hypothetical protein
MRTTTAISVFCILIQTHTQYTSTITNETHTTRKPQWRPEQATKRTKTKLLFSRNNVRTCMRCGAPVATLLGHPSHRPGCQLYHQRCCCCCCCSWLCLGSRRGKGFSMHNANPLDQNEKAMSPKIGLTANSKSCLVVLFQNRVRDGEVERQDTGTMHPPQSSLTDRIHHG